MNPHLLILPRDTAHRLAGINFHPALGKLIQDDHVTMEFIPRRFGMSGVCDVLVQTRPPIEGLHVVLVQECPPKEDIFREALTDARGRATLAHVLVEVACSVTVIGEVREILLKREAEADERLATERSTMSEFPMAAHTTDRSAVMPFRMLLERWEQIRAGQATEAAAEEFFLSLTAGPERWWFHVCWKLAHDRGHLVEGGSEPSDEQVAAIWDRAMEFFQRTLGEFAHDLVAVARLQFECARELRKRPSGSRQWADPRWRGWIEMAERICRARHPESEQVKLLPNGIVWDLVAELRQPEDPFVETRVVREEVVVGRSQLPIVLVPRNGRDGMCGTLELELLVDGTGEFYPAPSMSLVATDPSFDSALRSVRAYLVQERLWNRHCDIRWKVTLSTGMTRPIMGGSLGAAFALGASWLLAMHHLAVESPLEKQLVRVHHPESVCLTGSITESGELEGVWLPGVWEKIQAALHDARVSTLVLPRAALDAVTLQFGAWRSVHSPTTFRVPREFSGANALTILCEATFADALASIMVEWEMPWELNWTRRRQGHERRVERPWIEQEIQNFIQDHESGLLLIEGATGTGKSEFVMEQLKLPKGQEKPIGHFITPVMARWDEPAEFFGSLCAQARRKHRLEIPQAPHRSWSPDPAEAAAEQFVALLEKIFELGRREVIWLDGLDEAYGERGRYRHDEGPLHDLLGALRKTSRQGLPVGIYLIVTSRHDRALDLFRGCCDSTINLDEEKWGHEVEKDIARYFKQAVTTLLPELKAHENDLLAGVNACNRNFLCAELWLRSWQITAGPGAESTLDGLLHELLDREIVRLASAWHMENTSLDPLDAGAEVVDALGLLAAAKEPLTHPLIEQLLPARAAGIRRIHAMAAGLFLDRAPAGTGDLPLSFFHNCVAEFLLEAHPSKHAPELARMKARLKEKKGTADLRDKWLSELAAACAGWEKIDNLKTLAYALRHLPAYLRLAEKWDELVELLTDARFLQAKLGIGYKGMHDLLSVLYKALHGTPQLPVHDEKRLVLNALLQALSFHAERFAEQPLLALQQIHNEVAEQYHPERWFQKLLGVLQEGEANGQSWLKMSRPPAVAGTRPVSLNLHRNSVLAIAIAPSRRPDRLPMLATVGADQRLGIWKGSQLLHDISLSDGPSLRSPEPLNPWQQFVTGYPVTGAAFVRGGAQVVCASASGIHVINSATGQRSIDPRTGNPLLPFGISKGLPHSLAAAKRTDVSLVVIGYADGSARVWDLDRQDDIAVLGLSLYATSPKSAQCASAPKRPVQATHGEVHCAVAISADGTTVAVGCPDQWVTIYRLDIEGYLAMPDSDRRLPTPEILLELPPTAVRRVDDLDLSTDGKLLVVGGGFHRGMVELWDLKTGDCVLFHGHQDSVWSTTFATNPSTRDTKSAEANLLLCTGSYDRTFAVWSVAAIRLAAEAASQARSIQGVNRSHTLRELSGRLAPQARMAHRDVVMAVAVSSDNAWLATGSADYSALLWNFRDLVEPSPSVLTITKAEQADIIHTAAFHPAGKLIATGSQDGAVQLRIVETGQPLQRIDFNGEAVRVVKYSGDGRRLVIGTQGTAAVCMLDEEGSQALVRKTIRMGYFYAAEFSHGADAPRLATGDASGNVYVHSVTTDDAPRRCPQPHGKRVRALAFSRDNRWLASAGDDHKLVIWDLTSDVIHTPSGGADGHRGRIKSVAFSHDGAWLATGGRETIKLWAWSGSAWALHSTLRGHRDEIWTLVFSPCDRLLASGSRDTTARIWEQASGRMLCCLPCTNYTLAVQFNDDATELRVADSGPGGRVPRCYTAEIRAVPRSD